MTMKKIIFSLAFLAFLSVPLFLSAQSPIDKVFEKYAAQDGFTSVNITKDMFQLFMQMGIPK